MAAEVWSSTWVPGPCPIDGFGTADGYAVAWIQFVDGSRVQALVREPAQPPPGQRGVTMQHQVDEENIFVFTSEDDAQ